MQIGMIGLGRMGADMVRRLLQKGHECIVFDMKTERYGFGGHLEKAAAKAGGI